MYITPMKFYYGSQLGRSIRKPVFKDKAMDNYIESLRPSEYFDLIRENPYALVDARKGLLFTNPNIFAYINDTPYNINLYGMLVKCRHDELLKREKYIIPDNRKLEIWDKLAFRLSRHPKFNPNAQVKGTRLIEFALECDDMPLAGYLVQNKNFVPVERFNSSIEAQLYKALRAEMRALKAAKRVIAHAY